MYSKYLLNIISLKKYSSRHIIPLKIKCVVVGKSIRISIKKNCPCPLPFPLYRCVLCNPRLGRGNNIVCNLYVNMLIFLVPHPENNTIIWYKAL